MTDCYAGGPPMAPLPEAKRYRPPRVAGGLGHDGVAFFANSNAMWVKQDDPDYESAPWPDLMNQTRLAEAMIGARCEDEEVDDADTGIDDVPHDALTEDGI